MDKKYLKTRQDNTLLKLCLSNLKKLCGGITKAMKDRLCYELDVIKKSGKLETLELLRDIVQYSKKNNILLSPGRGPNAGSLVLYALGFTKVNPLTYGLYFECFLNPEKLQFPVVYFDVEAGKENKLLSFLENKYGKGKAAIAGSYDKTKYSPEVAYIGLPVLATIANTLKVIEKSKGVKIDIDDIPLNDKKVYQLISSGDTEDVFPFTSGGIIKTLKELKPATIQELSLPTALYRPGLVKILQELLKRRKSKAAVKYLHPKLKPILKETYGLIAYREQVIQIAVQLAGYTLAQAEKLRYDFEKKIPGDIKKQKCFFICGSSALRVPEKTAEKIFDLLKQSAGYTSTKSHSISWAILAYQSAYLKTYHRN